jgi:hypothetical protein
MPASPQACDVGRLWEGRFKASAIQQDQHLLIVMRSGERNALRASLVRPIGANDWVTQTARDLGMSHSIAPRGGPRRKPFAEEEHPGNGAPRQAMLAERPG